MKYFFDHFNIFPLFDETHLYNFLKSIAISNKTIFSAEKRYLYYEMIKCCNSFGWLIFQKKLIWNEMMKKFICAIKKIVWKFTIINFFSKIV